MSNIAKNFYHLRVYKQLPLGSLLNLMLCNRIMKSKPLVTHANKIYKLSNCIFGKQITNALINRTFCRALTAGNTLKQVQQVCQPFRKLGISVILDYCAQGTIGQTNRESTLDQNAKMFAKSAEVLMKYSGQMISIKITGLVDMGILKRMNDSVLARNNFWKDNSIDGLLTGQIIFKSLQKKYSAISDTQLTNYLKNIYNYTGNPKQFIIDETNFKMKHMPYYFGNNPQLKNQDIVIRLFFPLDQNDYQKLDHLQQRLNLICQPFANKNNDFKILVDAEQSYVQRAIQCISQQLQQTYNKQSLYILPTIQNYLKHSVERTKYQIQIAKRKKLILGAKLVRGAYIVEETALANNNNTENPIADGYDKTTENYLASFRALIDSQCQGEVLVASHNQDTITQTTKIHKQIKNQLKMSCAQLLGLADHLTYKAKIDGYKVYKYLPWANVEVMVSYMIRRAEQLNHMKYPLDVQLSLLNHELKSRILS